jgi:hypothetical protein
MGAAGDPVDSGITRLLAEMEQRWQRELAEQARIPQAEAYVS